MVPEYREEYEEISEKCRKLSVELLDQCIDTNEVHTLLKERTGSKKYFRFTKEMQYPRLRLAIEHNNKEFVGHMYCQQTLMQQWQADVPWQGASTIFKIGVIFIEYQILVNIVWSLVKKFSNFIFSPFSITSDIGSIFCAFVSLCKN